MQKYAVVKTGGKQYLVKEQDEIMVDNLNQKEKAKIELETLCVFNGASKIQLGTPMLKSKTKAEVIENLKGDKVRVARFKAKVRYRKVKGFRPSLTKIKILTI